MFAILIALSRRPADSVDEAVFGRVADWILDIDARDWRNSPDWLGDPPPSSFCLQYGFWKPIARELQERIATIKDDRVREKLSLCALLLDEFGFDAAVERVLSV